MNKHLSHRESKEPVKAHLTSTKIALLSSLNSKYSQHIEESELYDFECGLGSLLLHLGYDMTVDAGEFNHLVGNFKDWEQYVLKSLENVPTRPLSELMTYTEWMRRSSELLRITREEEELKSKFIEAEGEGSLGLQKFLEENFPIEHYDTTFIELLKVNGVWKREAFPEEFGKATKRQLSTSPYFESIPYVESIKTDYIERLIANGKLLEFATEIWCEEQKRDQHEARRVSILRLLDQLR